MDSSLSLRMTFHLVTYFVTTTKFWYTDIRPAVSGAYAENVLMSTLFSTEHLGQLLTHHLKIDINAVTITPVGATGPGDFFLAQSNQGNFILRLFPADDAPHLFFEKTSLRQLPALHALIRAKTSVPVPEIIAHDFSRTLIARDFLILEAKTGVSLKQIEKINHRQYNKVLHQLGKSLRQLHAVTGQNYGYANFPLQESPSSYRQTFGLLWQRLIGDVVRAGVYTSQDADHLTRLWQRHQAQFNRHAPPCLLQMNMCAEHFLVDEEANLVAILDFSQAMWGDPELDFAVADYYGVYASAFWQGYGQPRPNDPASQIRRRFYLMYEIQKHIPVSIWRDKSPADAKQAKQMVLTIADNIPEP